MFDGQGQVTADSMMSLQGVTTLQNTQMMQAQNIEVMTFTPQINTGDIQQRLELMQQQLTIMQTENLKLHTLNTALNKRVEILMEQIKNSRTKSSYIPPEWSDEEDMAAKETTKQTECILQLNQKSKKRKRSESASPVKNLMNSPQAKQTNKSNDKPPPIIVNVEKGVAPIMEVLNQFGVKFYSNRLNDYQLKINVTDSDAYRLVTSQLSEHGFQYHSYENKQTRPIRVMARNIHQSCSEEQVLVDLQQQGYKISAVSQKLKITRTGQGTVKVPLPLYMLTFQSDEDVRKIHEIRYICNMKVSIENLRKSKLIPQCKKCQQFGHTQKFCHNAYKCVKCGNAHETANCKKERSAPPKCCNCGEAHPANYRGCCVAKKLQELRDKKSANKNNDNNDKTVKNLSTQERKVSAESIKPQRDLNVTYAQVAKNTSPKKPETNENITEILTLLLSKMNEMEQKISEIEKHQPKTSKNANNWNKNGRK